jgi:HPt (histidine-containing phosphotransfer) domain-containing protein
MRPLTRLVEILDLRLIIRTTGTTVALRKPLRIQRNESLLAGCNPRRGLNSRSILSQELAATFAVDDDRQHESKRSSLHWEMTVRNTRDNTMTHTDEPVRSEFADDADFAELLEMFVDSVSEKREALTAAAAAGDVDQLRTLSHQLKGAGGGYGFTGLSAVAAYLEAACKENDETQIDSHTKQLLDYLGRICV